MSFVLTPVDVQDLDECERLEECLGHAAETKDEREITSGSIFQRTAKQVWRQASKDSSAVWRGVRRHRSAWVLQCA